MIIYAVLLWGNFCQKFMHFACKLFKPVNVWVKKKWQMWGMPPIFCFWSVTVKASKHHVMALRPLPKVWEQLLMTCQNNSFANSSKIALHFGITCLRIFLDVCNTNNRMCILTKSLGLLTPTHSLHCLVVFSPPPTMMIVLIMLFIRRSRSRRDPSDANKGALWGSTPWISLYKISFDHLIGRLRLPSSNKDGVYATFIPHTRSNTT